MADGAKVNWWVIVHLIVGLSGGCWAQDIDAGKSEFQSSCASCHGVDGKGIGPLSAQLKVAPADLTVLAKKNNGVLPINSVYEIIDGRKVILGHGTREMPIWGKQYTEETLSGYLVPQGLNKFDFNFDPDAIVRTRILSLIEYLSRIQEK